MARHATVGAFGAAVIVAIMTSATIGAPVERTTVSLANPVWSPDGRYLALADNGHNGVYLYDTNTDACLRITDAPSSGYAYRWRRDR